MFAWEYSTAFVDSKLEAHRVATSCTCKHQEICGKTLTRLAAALAARKRRQGYFLDGPNSSHYVNDTQISFSWRMKHLIA